METHGGYPKNAYGFQIDETHISKLRRLLPHPFKFSENLGIFFVFVSVFSRRFLQELSVCLLLVSPPARASLSSHRDTGHDTVLVLGYRGFQSDWKLIVLRK